MSKLLLALVALLCVVELPTANGQDVRVDIQRLLQIAEDIDDKVDDLEDDMDDIEDEIEDMDDEIEDFGEGIEGMETRVQAVTAEMIGLREEMKKMRSVFETGLEETREKVESETDRLGDRVKNWTQFLRDDTQDIKEEVNRQGEKVSEDVSQLRDSIQALKDNAKIDVLEEQLQTVLVNTTENQLVLERELVKIETSVENVSTGLGIEMENLQGTILANVTENHLEVREDLAHLQNDTDILGNSLMATVERLEQHTLILANHTETELSDVKEELTNMREHIGNKGNSLESELHKVTESHLEVREELAGLQRDMNSTLHLLKDNTKLKVLEEQLQTVLANSTENQLVLERELARIETSVENISTGLGIEMENLQGTILANVTENHLEVREDLANLQNDTDILGNSLMATVEGLEQRTLILANHTETELSDVKEELANMREHIGNKVNGLTESHLEIREELAGLQRDMNSTLYLLKDNTKLKVLEEQLQTVLANTTENHFEVKEELADLRNNLLNKIEGLANHTEMEQRDMKEELTIMRDSLEGELHEVTESHLEIREELAGLQRDMNSTLFLLQDLRSQLVNLRQENSTDHHNILASSCSELQPYRHSGYYLLRGSSQQVYCDMDRQSCGCGSTPGWMRVADINMTDPNQQCPEGFRLRSGTSTRMCEMNVNGRGCTSIVFPTHSVQYSRVCGRAQAYQYRAVIGFAAGSAFGQQHVDDTYVDGFSVTHGQSPREHIWTFAAGIHEVHGLHSPYQCPCITANTASVPSFVGNDYFCDTGSRQHWQIKLYTEDPLWDGEGCGPTSSCCQFNSPPWFCKELPQPTTDDIELRVCNHGPRTDGDTPFEVIQLYVQ